MDLIISGCHAFFVYSLFHLIDMGVLSCIPRILIHRGGFVSHIIFTFVKYFLVVICFLIVKIHHSKVLELRHRKRASLCWKVRISISLKFP